MTFGEVDDATMVTMRGFCGEQQLPADVIEYMSAISTNTNALLALLGTSDGELKIEAKADGLNYYKRSTLSAFVMPKIANVIANIRRIKGKSA